MKRCHHCDDVATYGFPALDRIGSRKGLCETHAIMHIRRMERDMAKDMPYRLEEEEQRD